MKKLIAGLVTFLTAVSAFAFTDVDNQALWQKNILQNPGFENGKTGWSDSSAGTFSLTSGAASSLYGSASGVWQGTTSGQYLRSNSYTLSQGLYGQACLGGFYYRYGASTLTADIISSNGGSVISSVLSATGSSTVNRVLMSFTCPTSGSLQIGVRTNATNSASIVLDNFYLGNDFANGASVLSSTASWTGYHDNDCGGAAWVTTGASYADAGDDASCTFTQLENNGFGTVSSLGTKKPGISFIAPRIKHYMVIASIVLTSNVAGNYVSVRMLDDLSNELSTGTTLLNNSTGSVTLVGILNVTALTTRTVRLQTAGVGGANYNVGVAGGFGISQGHSINWSIVELPN